MTHEIPPEIAVHILSSAFVPLYCGAEAFDFNHFIRFRVFDANDQPLLRMGKLTAMDYGSPRGLERIINEARSTLASLGHELAPWQMPDAAASGRLG